MHCKSITLVAEYKSYTFLLLLNGIKNLYLPWIWYEEAKLILVILCLWYHCTANLQTTAYKCAEKFQNE